MLNGKSIEVEGWRGGNKKGYYTTKLSPELYPLKMNEYN